MPSGRQINCSFAMLNANETMQKRGVAVNHSSINRWAIRFLPLLKKAFRDHKRPVASSWRMDETCILLKGVWKYLCRAADKSDKTFEILLTAKLDEKVSMLFLRRPERPTPSRESDDEQEPSQQGKGADWPTIYAKSASGPRQ